MELRALEEERKNSVGNNCIGYKLDEMPSIFPVSLRNPGPAGVGGLCRDDAGKVLWAFWGPLVVTGATEAEVQAVFNGIKKVGRDCLKSVIVEGDSFNVIRWLRGGVAPPWRFLDLFDEMKDILAESDIELIHVRRSANEKADALARRGVVCNSMNWSDQFPI
ncbi:uncharacterized protein LOC143852327 [Tasmannia lanceolata]|uniref:uncharacterized protein LOC143852327 n=1 Tax=Tasmannia lanceolata TaxID=3420 RepID=UPI0040641991